MVQSHTVPHLGLLHQRRQCIAHTREPCLQCLQTLNLLGLNVKGNTQHWIHAREYTDILYEIHMREELLTK